MNKTKFGVQTNYSYGGQRRKYNVGRYVANKYKSNRAYTRRLNVRKGIKSGETVFKLMDTLNVFPSTTSGNCYAFQSGQSFSNLSTQIAACTQWATIAANWSLFRLNGMSIRELSNLMRDQKMTAEATSKAIVLGQTEINEKYKLSQKTFEQAFTVFNNGLTKYVGTLNAATGTSNMFFNAMKGLSENIDLMVAGMIGLGAAMLTFALNTERAAAAGALMARTPAGFAIGALAMGATYSISKSQNHGFFGRSGNSLWLGFYLPNYQRNNEITTFDKSRGVE